MADDGSNPPDRFYEEGGMGHEAMRAAAPLCGVCGKPLATRKDLIAAEYDANRNALIHEDCRTPVDPAVAERGTSEHPVTDREHKPGMENGPTVDPIARMGNCYDAPLEDA